MALHPEPKAPVASTARWITCLLALFAALGLATCGIVGPLAAGHLDIEQADLQARIAPRFPVHYCKAVVLCVDLADPVLGLQEGDARVHFSASVQLALGSRARSGRIGLSAKPRYAPASGQLFLDDLQITSLELAGFPDEAAELVKSQGARLARQALQAHAVYTLDDTTAKGALARRAVKEVRVVDGRLRISFAGERD